MPRGESESPAGVEPIPPELLEGLARPGAYPDDPSARAGVERTQTHLSVVFLTRERVYKLRKAVHLSFVSFATRASRNADCLREVELNRRLAPDVYLGVAPVERSTDGVRVGAVREELAAPDAAGRTPEHCVVMRRLPAGRDALSLLQRGKLRPRHVDAIAERVAELHEAHRLGPYAIGPEAWLARCTDPVAMNFDALEPAAGRLVPAATLERARRRAQDFEREHATRFERRRRAGRGVDGHGDLHLQHAWFERDDAPPLLIDCLEFRDDLRRIDAASDVAFLAMDLAYRRRARLAERFLRRYARDTDDFDLYGVVDYFASYRAAVRAKVAALAADEEEIEQAQRRAAADSARRHLALAARLLETRRRPVLAVLCGIVGTGKSSAAEIVADELGGPIVASDRVRKRLFGLAPETRGGDELYTRERKAQVYDAMFERAAPPLGSGRVAVLDATFSKRAHRERARRFATQRGAAAVVVETRCAERIARDRLARRAADARDPSDAGPELYAPSAAAFEPPDEWEDKARIVVDTGERGWRSRLRREIRRARADLA